MSGLLSDEGCLIAGTNGIAGASARLFGREGARIAAVGRSENNAAALASELESLGVEHVVFAEDLTSAGAAERVLARVHERFGQGDVLFYGAGIRGRKFSGGPPAER